MKKILFPMAFFALTFSLSLCTYDKEEKVEETNDDNDDTTVVTLCDTLNITYDNGAKTIINANCAISGCHGAGSVYKDFTTYAGINQVISSGQFVKRVFDGNPSFMPPSGFSNSTDKDKLKCWIESGAKQN